MCFLYGIDTMSCVLVPCTSSGSCFELEVIICLLSKSRSFILISIGRNYQKCIKVCRFDISINIPRLVASGPLMILPL